MHIQEVWKSESALSDEFCDNLVRLGKEINHEYGFIDQDTVNTTVRNSRVAWINNPELTEVFYKCIILANKEAGWNFDIHSAEVMQFSTYYETGHYGWHMDIENSFDPAKVRKLSLVVSLNDNYEGGEFQFSWGKPSKSYHKRVIDCPELKKKGSIVVFPSFLWHRVKPVLYNEKHSIALWAYGPAFR